MLRRLYSVLPTTLALGLALMFGAASCDSPKQEETAKVRPKRSEDTAKKIDISIEYPAPKGHKTKRITLQNFDGQYEYDEDPVDEALIATLLGSLTELLPSDSVKTCRPAEGEPTLRINIPYLEGRAELFSNARCENRGPWNVVIDGKLQLQLNGAIGKASLPLLKLLASEYLKESQLKPGVFSLLDGSPAPEGVTAQQSPTVPLTEKLQATPAFKTLVGTRPLHKMVLACNQEGGNEDCKTLFGMTSLELAPDVLLAFEFKLGEQGGSDYTLPSDLSELTAFVQSKPATVLKEVSPAKLLVKYEPKGECDAVLAAAPKLMPDVEASSIDCAQFIFTAEVPADAQLAPPKLVFFPGLKAAWLFNEEGKTDRAYYEKLGIDEKGITKVFSGSAEWFVDLQGVLVEIPI